MVHWLKRLVAILLPYLVGMGLGMAIVHVQVYRDQGGNLWEMPAEALRDISADWSHLAAVFAPPGRPPAGQPTPVAATPTPAPADPPDSGSASDESLVNTSPEPAAAPPQTPRPAPRAPPECGPQPRGNDPALQQHMACQLLAICLERLAETRRMIDEGRTQCLRSGNTSACNAYYQSLERQYDPTFCDAQWERFRRTLAR